MLILKDFIKDFIFSPLEEISSMDSKHVVFFQV